MFEVMIKVVLSTDIELVAFVWTDDLSVWMLLLENSWEAIAIHSTTIQLALLKWSVIRDRGAIWEERRRKIPQIWLEKIHSVPYELRLVHCTIEE